jgi:hypothetical protein
MRPHCISFNHVGSDTLQYAKTITVFKGVHIDNYFTIDTNDSVEFILGKEYLVYAKYVGGEFIL